jgi:hypothetical protein
MSRTLNGLGRSSIGSIDIATINERIDDITLESGIKGDTGNTGQAGSNGVAGAAGATGSQGATGAAGATGAPGAKGADGADGTLTDQQEIDINDSVKKTGEELQTITGDVTVNGGLIVKNDVHCRNIRFQKKPT